MFYINLPVGGVSLSLLWLFLCVKWDKETKTRDKLKRIDLMGNSLLVASTVSVLIALTWADSEHPWSSYRILVPLVIGLVGLVGFFFLEGSRWVPEPVMFVSNNISLPQHYVFAHVDHSFYILKCNILFKLLV